MARITSVEMTVTLSDGREATATIDADGNIFRGGDYDSMCEIVEATEAMRSALFDGGHMAGEDDEEVCESCRAPEGESHAATCEARAFDVGTAAARESAQ